MSTTPAPPDEVAARFNAARDRVRAQVPNGASGGLGDHNPYAHDKRVQMNHRVHGKLLQRLADLSEQLLAMGYTPRQVSQAELLQMVMHFFVPHTAADAIPILQQWGALKMLPPEPPTDE